MSVKSIESKLELPVYPKRDIELVRGSGARVWDVSGKEYVDCNAGNAVASVGHCNEKVVAAICEQAKKLMICSGGFYHARRAEALERLLSIVPQNLTKAFLCNSGCEAIEGAIKFSRLTTKRPGIIAAERGFHGRTFGALSATYNPKYRLGFEPLLPEVSHIPFNNVKALKEAVTDKTAAVLLEVIQGEGGIYLADPDFLRAAREICDERGAMLIFDEIQTGFCRTGKFFACQRIGVSPDIMCVAKAIAGGVPMGAIICSDKVVVDIGKHGSTFGGNPLACSAAIAAIDFMLEEDLAEQACEKGDYLYSHLTEMDLPAVKEIRHAGLMMGIELTEPSKPYIEKLAQEGVLVLAAGETVIRLLPPLVIDYSDIDFVLEKLQKVLGAH